MVDNIRSAVNRIIRKRGYEIRLMRFPEAGDYNAETGEVDRDDPVEITLRGVEVAYRKEHIDNTNVLASDRLILVDPETMSQTPQVGDFIKGTQRSIQSVREYRPNNTIIGYALQVRG